MSYTESQTSQQKIWQRRCASRSHSRISQNLTQPLLQVVTHYWWYIPLSNSSSWSFWFWSPFVCTRGPEWHLYPVYISKQVWISWSCFTWRRIAWWSWFGVYATFGFFIQYCLISIHTYSRSSCLHLLYIWCHCSTCQIAQSICKI